MLDADREQVCRVTYLPAVGFVSCYTLDTLAFFPCSFAKRNEKIHLSCSIQRARTLPHLKTNHFSAELLEPRRR